MILGNFKLPEQWFKNEAEFTTWFGRQITTRWGFFHKISDYSPWYKPFDAIFAYNGDAGAIEFKSITWKSCTPFDLLRWSSPKNPWAQVKWLWDYKSNWWSSYVVVYSKATNSYKVCSFDWVSNWDRLSFIS